MLKDFQQLTERNIELSKQYSEATKNREQSMLAVMSHLDKTNLKLPADTTESLGGDFLYKTFGTKNNRWIISTIPIGISELKRSDVTKGFQFLSFSKDGISLLKFNFYQGLQFFIELRAIDQTTQKDIKEKYECEIIPLDEEEAIAKFRELQSIVGTSFRNEITRNNSITNAAKAILTHK